jgi:hypothetical protein
MCASNIPYLPLADATYDAVLFDLDGVLRDTASFVLTFYLFLPP